jgi:hypothetical protein
MALPIKPSDTQEGCNPISSNCVIWQGPDIPCINLCNGDSVSDVVAKLAERLCTIADQLDISLLDLSCFNPIFPTPQNFRDVVQLIINRVCALENPTVNPDAPVTTPCPDDCIVTIASCFQERDFLGNLITTLPLKDYVIKIGNEVCGILSTITTIQTSITNLDTRVTDIENNCCNQTIDINLTSCISGGTVLPLVEFLLQLETAFCELQPLVGTSGDVSLMLNAATCVPDSAEQLGNPPAVMSAITGWVPGASNIAETVNNLWLTVCDLRTALTNLQADLAACCDSPPVCPSPTIDIIFNKPNIAFTCTPLPSPWTISTVTAQVRGSVSSYGPVTNPTIVGPFTADGITPNDIVNTTSVATLDNSIYFNVSVSVTLSDGAGNTCTILESVVGLDGGVSCATASLAAYEVLGVPQPGKIELTYNSLPSGLLFRTTLYNATFGTPVTGPITIATPITDTYLFTGLSSGQTYKASIEIVQNAISKNCGYTATFTCP